MNTSEKVEMWLSACRKISQGIKMEYCDTYTDSGQPKYWYKWYSSKDKPCFPNFDPNVNWREFEDQNKHDPSILEDDLFEEYLNVLRKIRAGIKMEYKSNEWQWDSNEYVEWDDIRLPQFDVSHTWRECQPKSIENVKI